MATHDHHIVDSMRQRVVELCAGPAGPRRAARRLRNGSLSALRLPAQRGPDRASSQRHHDDRDDPDDRDLDRPVRRRSAGGAARRPLPRHLPRPGGEPGLPDQRRLGQRPDLRRRSVQGAAAADRGSRRRAVRAFPESRRRLRTTRSRSSRSTRTSPARTAFPASFIVKLDDPEQHKDFDEAIAGQPGVLNVLNQKDLIDRLFAVLDGLVQRGVRGGVGAGGRRGVVDRQHGSGGRLHPTHRDRHHATGRRQSVVHPAAVPVGSGAGRAHRRGHLRSSG